MASQVEDIKWLPCAATGDKRFLVDGFLFKTRACRHYFLTHFHSDHTCGLTKGVAEYGIVYTSEVTARLLVHDMGFPASAIAPMPLNTPFMVEGCRITMLDANHCPGAVMLLVEVLQDSAGASLAKPQVILHTGDCRWEDRLAAHIPAGLHIDTLFLDTTYCIPRYTFPQQATVINELCAEIKQLLEQQPRSLLVVAAYHIGKEKVFMGVAQQLGLKVWCTERKRGTLAHLGLPAEQIQLLTDNPQEAQLHVSSWGGMRPDQIQQRFLADLSALAATDGPQPPQQDAMEGDLRADADDADDDVGADLAGLGVQVKEEGGSALPTGPDASEEASAAAAVKGQCGWTHVIGIRATGWSFRKKAKDLISRWVSGPVTLLSAPYSEHSSYAELCSCVRLLRPARIIPTANAPTPAAAKAIVERFVHLMDLSKQRGRMDMYLRKAASTPALPNGSPCSTAAVNSAHVNGLAPHLTSVRQASAPPVVPAISPNGQVTTIDLTIEEELEDISNDKSQPAQQLQHPQHSEQLQQAQQLPPQQQLQGGGPVAGRDLGQCEVAIYSLVAQEPIGESAGHGVPAMASKVAGVESPDVAKHSALPTTDKQDERDMHCPEHQHQLQVEVVHKGPHAMDCDKQLQETKHQQPIERCLQAHALLGEAQRGPSATVSPVAAERGTAPECTTPQQTEDCVREVADGLPGVDAREQQRIWDMIQTQLQQQQQQQAGTPSISKAGPIGTGTKRRKGTSRVKEEAKDGSTGTGAPSKGSNAAAKSGEGAAAVTTPEVLSPGGRKRARVQSKNGPASGSRINPVVLDDSDAPDCMTVARSNSMPACSPVADSNRRVSNNGTGGGGSKQSSIRAFLSPASLQQP